MNVLEMKCLGSLFGFHEWKRVTNEEVRSILYEAKSHPMTDPLGGSRNLEKKQKSLSLPNLNRIIINIIW